MKKESLNTSLLLRCIIGLIIGVYGIYSRATLE
jgi:hypothetical protein